MTTYTKAALRNRVLQELGVLSPGETATADDAVLVEDVIDAVHAMLDREVFVGWTAAAIPDTVVEPLMAVVAARCAGRFGLPDARRQELILLAGQGMSDLYTQTAAEHNDAPIRAQFF